MNKKEIEQYIQVLSLDKDKRYIMIISHMSGFSNIDARNLTLPDNFHKQIIMVDGSVKDAIAIIDTEK